MAENIQLPDPPGADLSVHQAIAQRRSRREFGDKTITMDQLSELLWSAAGITHSNGRFRAAPSAGATYPFDTYVVIGDVEGIDSGIYKYIEESHQIEPVKLGEYISKVTDASLGQAVLRNSSLIICLFAIPERTTQRYGDRGYMYIHMEAGHIGQNIHLVCEALNLSTTMIGAFYDDKIADVFQVEGNPTYLMPVGPRKEN